MEEKMDESPLSLDDFDFPRTPVIVEEIRKYTDEDQFTTVSVELLKEVCQITSLLAGTYRLDDQGTPRKWTRNEAIIGGLMMRTSKLQMGFLDQICKNHLEIALIISRSLTEGIFNIIYLLNKNQEKLYDEYVIYSLKTEYDMLNRINQNIEKRGSKLDIETRIIKSIEHAFDISQISIDQVKNRKRETWGKSIYERLKAIGMESMYLVFMGLASHSVHGNWQDLIDHHLYFQDGQFSPKIKWSVARPEAILSVSILSIEANKWYLEKVIEESSDNKRLKELNDDVLVRTRVLDELHEQFINRMH